MPISYVIASDLPLVLTRMQGFVRWQECLEAARIYAADPRAVPLCNHVYDLRGVVGFERDYPAFLQMMAKLPPDLFLPPDTRMIVYVAPHAAGRELAGTILKSMSAVTGPVARIVEDVGQAAEVLGLPAPLLARLFDDRATRQDAG